MKQRTKEQGLAHIGIIIIVLAVIAAVAFSAWYVWQRNEKDSQEPSANANQTQDQTITEDKKSEQKITVPEGWLFYKNDEAGFSFYYPPEWGEVKKNESGSFGFSKLSGSMSFQANRRDKKHTEGGFGVQVHNAIDVLSNGESATITFLTGIDPPTRKETYGPDKLIKTLSKSRACVLEDISIYEIYGDPDSVNSHVLFGYCGLISDEYGTFVLDSPSMDITKTETQKLKEDITKLLQTFETF